MAVGLFLLAQFVIYEKVSELISQELAKSYEVGYFEGITDSARAIYFQTEDCQPTKVTIDNMTKNVLDLSCIDVQPISETP